MKAVRLLLAAAGVAAAGTMGRADISFDKSDVPAAPTPTPVMPASAPGPAPAPETAPDASTSGTASAGDSARIADFERRFAEGKQLEQEDKLTEALAIFSGILAEAPDAKGSLRESGIINFQLGNYPQADACFSKLHELVPDYPMAIEALIQVNQTLRHDAKVEILIKEFKDLWAAGKVPNPYFVRDRIRLDDGTEISITQFFDYHQPRYYAWVADFTDANHALKRRLTVNYDPDVTASLRAKDPALAHAEQFLLVDNVMTNGKVTRLDVYQQFLALPDYLKMRAIMLEVFANALKPIDSAPIPTGSP